MKVTKILLFALIALFLGSCEKDEIILNPEVLSSSSNFSPNELNWNVEEKNFFDLSNSIDDIQVFNRTSIHQAIVSVYNKVAEENEEHQFVESFIEKLGYPFWLNSKIAGDQSKDNFIIFTPIYSPDNKVTSYFVSTFSDGFVDVNLRVKTIVEESLADKTHSASTCVDYVMLKSFQYDMDSSFDGFNEKAYCEACLKNNKGGLDSYNTNSRCRENTNEWCIELDCDTGFPTGGSWTNLYDNPDTQIGTNGSNPKGGTITFGTISTGGWTIIHGTGGPGGNTDPDPDPDPTPDPPTNPNIALIGDHSSINASMLHSANNFNEGGGLQGQIENRDCEPELICNTYNVIECIDEQGFWVLVETLDCITCGQETSNTNSLQAAFNANVFMNTFFDNPSSELQDLILKAAEENGCENYPAGADEEDIDDFNTCVYETLADDDSIDEEIRCAAVRGYANYKFPGRLSAAEQQLITNNWNAAREIYKNMDQADGIVFSMFGNLDDNGCSNAFRHALWSALNTIDIGADLAEEFTTAHENIPQNPLNNMGMDLHNNSIGIRIGTTISTSSFQGLINALCAELVAGNLMVFAEPTIGTSPLIDSSGCSC